MFRRMVSSLLALFIATAAFADPIITGSKPYTFTPGTTISSSQVNANFDYIINQTNTNAAKNGVNTSITALLGLTTPLAPSAGGSSVYYATSVGGTVDAITVSATVPAVSSFSLTAGVTVVFAPTGTNTISGPTLNVNGTGAAILKRTTANGGVFNLRPNEIPFAAAPNTGLLWATYDGTQWIVMNASPPFGSAFSIASAATTDLGTAGSRYANVTGTTTITSFGSTCNPSLPIYLVKFTGALVLTHNATSLILPGGSNASIAAGDSLIAECLGSGNWKVWSIFYNTPVLVMGGVNGLTIQNNAGTPNTQVDVTWSGLAVLEGVSNFATDVIGPSTKTINAATTGANALDTGSLANNTWYYIYIISDGASLTAGLMSTSATTPTMPAGYTHKYRVGAIRTGGSATFNRIIQRGNKARYVVVTGSVTPNLPILFNGASGNVNTPTWTSIAVQNATLPATATEIDFIVTTSSSSGSQVVIMAPNNNYGPFASLTNPPAFATQMQNDGGIHNQQGNFVLESANIFYASTGASAPCAIMGWTDAVNAN